MDGTSTGALVVQVLVTGLAAGATYALVAFGFALLYRMTGVLQLAHGHVVSLGVLVALAALGVLGGGVVTTPARAVVAVVAAVVAAAAASVAIPVLGWRGPGEGRSRVEWLALVVAAAFAIEAGLVAASRRPGYAFPELLPGGRARVPLPLGASVTGHDLWQLGLALVLAVAIDVAMRRTAAGTLVSAVASSPRLAHLAGLPVRRAVLAAFALAGALAAVAGVLVADGSSVGPDDGVALGLWGMAAAAVTGFGSRRAILAVALGLGVAEAALVTLPLPGADGLRLGPAAGAALPAVATLAALALRRGAATRDEPA